MIPSIYIYRTYFRPPSLSPSSISFPLNRMVSAVDLDENRDIQNIQNMILKHVRSASVEALNFMKTFAKYEYIWLEDKQSYLKRFLNECEQKCLEDLDFSDDKIDDPNTQVDLFQAQVCVSV